MKITPVSWVLFLLVVVATAKEERVLTKTTQATAESTDPNADKVIGAMDSVSEAVASAEQKLQEIIAKAKAQVKKTPAATEPKTEMYAQSAVATMHKADKGPGGAMMPGPGQGGFDWQQFVPKNAGKPTKKTVDETPSANPAAGSGSTGGYDWQKWAPKDTTGGSFNKAPGSVMLGASDGQSMNMAAMGSKVVGAADALAAKLDEAAEQLKAASDKLKEKVDEVQAAMDSAETSTVDTKTTTNLRASNTETGSVVPGVLGVVAVVAAIGGVVAFRRQRMLYERL